MNLHIVSIIGKTLASLLLLNCELLEQSIESGREVIQEEDHGSFVDPQQPIEELFTVGRFLGSGTFGDVFEIFDKENNHFALKKQESISRMVHEFEMSLLLTHPTFMKIHHAVIKDEGTYLIMEKIEGRNLNKNYSLSKSEKLKAADDLLEALLFSLEIGIFPEDLYFANIMITDDHKLKIIDLAGYTKKIRHPYDYYAHQVRFALECIELPHRVNKEQVVLEKIKELLESNQTVR